MKKKDTILKEFTRALSDDDLKWLLSRLNQRLGGDLGEAVEALQTNVEIDRLLAAANSSFGLYDLADEVAEYLDRELRKRAYGSTDPSLVGQESKQVV